MYIASSKTVVLFKVNTFVHLINSNHLHYPCHTSSDLCNWSVTSSVQQSLTIILKISQISIHRYLTNDLGVKITPEGKVTTRRSNLLKSANISGRLIKAKVSSSSAESVKGFVTEHLPLACIGNLKEFLLDYLDRLERYVLSSFWLVFTWKFSGA